METFNVAQSNIVILGAVGAAIVLAVLGWRDSARRYADSPARRLAMQTFACLAGLGFAVYFVGSRREGVRVRGDDLDIRHAFERAYQRVPVTDIAYYDVDRYKPKGAKSYEYVTLTFADSSRIEVKEGYENYKRFRAYLVDQGVRERSILERPPVRYQR